MLYFTSPEGHGLFFFIYEPSVEAAFFASNDLKVRYFYIWTVY